MLVAEHITKRFAGVTALDGVNLSFPGGQVTAVLGENGAGKSTLMKILSGVYADYEGQVRYKGEVVRFQTPREAQDAGIAIIHQELNLIPYLSVQENIFLGREMLTRWGLLDKKAMRAKSQELLRRLQLPIDPDVKVASLKVGQQQVVEMAKALLLDAEVIIMDEPTSAISDSEVEVLFRIIEDLRRDGKAVVYISHKLDELFRIADRYVVLRDGRSIDAGEMQGMTPDALIRKMVGRDVHVIQRETPATTHQTLLKVEKLCLKHPVRRNDDQLKEICFTVGKGEIVGLFGLMGAGRTELLETLFGLYPKRSRGMIHMEGEAMTFRSPQDAIRAGLALVPEDRKQDGLVLGLDVKTNISLTNLDQLERMGVVLDGGSETAMAKKYIGHLGIKTPSETQLARNLSGGNQQKIVLAKWMATQPKLLLLDEPTRGIDIHAKNEIYKLIVQLAREGMGILVVSSELPEILALSDRILVMSEGCLTANLPAKGASEDQILKAAIPASTEVAVEK
ncbi:ribose transport system ATP-binding protein [Catalinimonas alkaloidigena]|uniref:Ribose transport system ATP-binding protein n=1 Tax=Catalinimonas alkaloidigena TaxID=1075417 RepID=A0A1G9KLU2_9BACT|nr:sugar ABC transporter ATP-binding protein [Catalinimonas alkaloidigena]SDL50642.1 ribose transport system ATP-binding protein [Catalinimonas alkaloidigena]